MVEEDPEIDIIIVAIDLGDLCSLQAYQMRIWDSHPVLLD